jgi:hypothetical protein
LPGGCRSSAPATCGSFAGRHAPLMVNLAWPAMPIEFVQPLRWRIGLDIRTRRGSSFARTALQRRSRAGNGKRSRPIASRNSSAGIALSFSRTTRPLLRDFCSGAYMVRGLHEWELACHDTCRSGTALGSRRSPAVRRAVVLLRLTFPIGRDCLRSCAADSQTKPDSVGHAAGRVVQAALFGPQRIFSVGEGSAAKSEIIAWSWSRQVAAPCP